MHYALSYYRPTLVSAEALRRSIKLLNGEGVGLVDEGANCPMGKRQVSANDDDAAGRQRV